MKRKISSFICRRIDFIWILSWFLARRLLSASEDRKILYLILFIAFFVIFLFDRILKNIELKKLNKSKKVIISMWVILIGMTVTGLLIVFSFNSVRLSETWLNTMRLLIVYAVLFLLSAVIPYLSKLAQEPIKTYDDKQQ